MRSDSTTVAVLIGREPADRYSVHRGYVDALYTVGALPFLLPPAVCVERYMAGALACDALLVTGGGDVDPWRYGAATAPETSGIDQVRDAAELAAIRAAVDTGVPVLGICRGIQAVAVALGGTLLQHVTGHCDEERQHEPIHPVTAATGSVAAEVLCGATGVNSIHHQAVREPGARLKATAWGPDGVIEAVEAPGVLGIQWHPERLAPIVLAPFEWLVATSRRRVAA